MPPDMPPVPPLDMPAIIQQCAPNVGFDTMKAIVSDHFGAGVTASFGFAYADGVDSAEMPQSATYYGAGIVLSAAGEIPIPIKAKLQALPKDAFLTMTVTGAGVAQSAYADVVVRGEQAGV